MRTRALPARCWIFRTALLTGCPLPKRLASALTQTRRTLYVPERYGPSVPGAIPLICTALSGGDFGQRLREAASAAGGAGRLALDVQRLRMDFTLPARTGEGVPLSPENFQALMERESPSVFFSQELCARYFTYTRAGETHFVLFDDAGTLRKKIQTGAALGYSAAFFMFPEVRDLPGGAVFPAEKRAIKKHRARRHGVFPVLNRNASCSCERPQTSCGA